LVEHFGSWVCDRCAVCSSWTRRRTFLSDNGCKWLAVFQARPTKTNLIKLFVNFYKCDVKSFFFFLYLYFIT
jgi:hypothetical protein